MKLKLDDKGNVVMQDGKPVYIMDNGQEVAFDAPATVATIARLNNESKTHRERAEKAEQSLTAFAGIEDPAAAISALKTIKNIDDKKLVDAGKVEEIKTAAVAATKAQYEPVVKERDTLKDKLNRALIGGSFTRSQYIKDKLTIPADLVEARFASQFSLDDQDRVIAKDRNGNIIYSPARPGEPADFDEAMQAIVDGYSQKASILKSEVKGGGGAAASGGGQGGGGGKTMKRSDFEALPPAERQAKAREGVAFVD